jgi:hypothetical protein
MKKQKKTILALVVFTAFIAVVMFVPGLISAGSLEPSAAPAPTMKTLDQIPPTWSEKITTGRFVDALGGAAVLDKETGLVWEKSPSTSTYTWISAINYCANLNVGGRKGWHLPTVEQLASLVDNSVSGSPKLPTGHPFLNVQSFYYWSATTYANDATVAWYVNFTNGFVGLSIKTNDYYAWCVRGGQSHDGQ